MKKILVLRGGALGDFIVTLPALDRLRARWPSAQIELVGNATAGAIARDRGLLDAVHSQHEARWSALFAAADALLPSGFAAWLGEFDLIVNYWPDPDGELRRRFPIRPGQIIVSASAVPERAPAAAHYCEALRAVGVDAHDTWFRLAPDVAASVSEWEAANRPLAHACGYIAVHPGSGSPRKNWPAENWRVLISQLPAPVSVILGEAELEKWSRISRSGSPSVDIAPDGAAGKMALPFKTLVSPSLEELITHISGARLFLGHDSGVSHLAAACGVPCILLFGPTDPAMWAPPAPHVRVLRREAGLESISVSEVQAEVAAALEDRR